jgi:hypothetical protein
MIALPAAFRSIVRLVIALSAACLTLTADLAGEADRV